VLGDSRIIHPASFRELYSIGREALYNAFRHSNAKLIELELHYTLESLTLRVRDDGDGMGEDVLRDKKRAGHWGLPGMHERAEKLGGTVTLWSGAGSGTEIEVTVPGTVYREVKESLVPGWVIRWLRPRRSTTD
jgi:signal transduction histidine kinase